MSRENVSKIFTELISTRAWYKGTTIDRFKAKDIKRSFNAGTLLLGRQVEVLLECGYTINIDKQD